MVEKFSKEARNIIEKAGYIARTFSKEVEYNASRVKSFSEECYGWTVSEAADLGGAHMMLFNGLLRAQRKKRITVEELDKVQAESQDILTNTVRDADKKIEECIG